MTSNILHTPSHTWQHRSYICHLTLYIWYFIHCLCVIKPSVSIVLHTLCMTLHTLCMTSHSVCMTSHEHFMKSHAYRYDITCSIFMTYPIYMKSPILFHENKTTISGISTTVFDITAVAPALSMPSTQLWKSSHSAHVWHHTNTTSHPIQSLWHQSSVFRTSQKLHSWYQISYIWHLIHGLWHLIPYTCDITATILVT